MRNLIRFLVKNSFVFLFLFLEFIAFTLLVQNNRYQSSKVLNSSNFLVGNLYTSVNNFKEYLGLKNINEELATHNATLQSKQIESFVKLYGNSVRINDTIYKQQYVYTNAKIVNNTVNKRNNYITINKGELNGIESGMGVISANGSVGIVKNVSDNFSSIISILHKDAKISGKIKRSGYYGSVIWDGTDYRKGNLFDIPNHVKVEIGDTVVTSGYSSIFPENIPIGIVSGFDLPEGSNFYEIEIDFSVDYKNISQVYIIKNLLKEEQKEIEALNQEEND